LKRPKLLGLCFYPAFTPPRSGGELRLFHMYRELARWYDVVLLSSTFHGVPEERVVHGHGFIERRIPKDEHFIAAWQELQPHAGEGDLSSLSVGFAGCRDTLLNRAYLEEYADASVIVHEVPFTIDYDLFIGFDSKVRVYNSQNCESDLVRQLHQAVGSDRLHTLVETWERKLLQHADVVTFCAESDLQGFERLAGRTLSHVLELPNGLMPLADAPSQADPHAPLHAIFVAGAHLPNVAAARFIAQELAPSLPGLVFDIVGACLPEGRYGPNVVRHGMVDSQTKDRLLRSASLALNPMESGSGSNLKLLEFFNHGLPVVSTPFGVRGYPVSDGQECLLAPIQGFAAAIRRLASDAPRRAELGRRARAFAEGRFSWAAIAQRLHECLQALPPRPPRVLDQRFVLGLNDYDPFSGQGGGAIRIQGLTAAVDAVQPVVYLCLSDGALSAQRIGTQSVVIKVPKTSEHVAAEQAANARFWVSVNDILATRYAPLNATLRALYALLRERAGVIALDHPYMVSLPAAFGDDFVYSSQNHEIALKQRSLTYHPDRDTYVAIVEQAESMAIESASCVVAVADDEALAMLAGRHEGSPTLTVRNGANPPVQPDAADDETAVSTVGPGDAAFVGSAHAPNVESVQFIVQRLAPALPQVKFHILGTCAAPDMPAPPNVKVWGAVTESLKSAVLLRCGFALNPMFSGSGSNVKLADYLGHGLHVVSTAFGARGYPSSVEPHVTVAEADDFARAVEGACASPARRSAEQRAARRALFERELSMRSLAGRYAELLQELQQPRRRALFVTYRWVWPVLGGGEAHLLQHLKALVRDGGFSVDVVAADVAGIHDQQRFGAGFEAAAQHSAPVGLPHIRYRRFPIAPIDPERQDRDLRALWRTQPRFERELMARLPHDPKLGTCLTWGWTWPGGKGEGRWTLSAFALHLAEPGTLVLQAHSPRKGGLLAVSADGRQLAQIDVGTNFELSLELPAGEVEFEVAATPVGHADARPLGLYVQALRLNGTELDLSSTQRAHLPLRGEGPEVFARLDGAANASRVGAAASLSLVRGPHAPDLEHFLAQHAAQYDLVITHNVVMRTHRVAIEAARGSGTPVLTLPHAHLDDDYYHFPADTATVVSADAVGAVPHAACDFYRQRGAGRVAYAPPGCDATETFTEEDEQAFRAVRPGKRPFILVLGRKAPAKGYRAAIRAVEQVAMRHEIDLLMIGPDDDGQPLNSSVAHYLGLQPRQVLRGALRSCLALVNMSISESFGMVLLEAWLARKAVIVNRYCVAFQDVARHGENALLADEQTLADAIESLVRDPALAARLGESGFELAQRYDWSIVNRNFVELCQELADAGARGRAAQVHDGR
jgi:glycosyltransferase involved in cell wall biosynthesis